MVTAKRVEEVEMVSEPSAVTEHESESAPVDNTGSASDVEAAADTDVGEAADSSEGSAKSTARHRLSLSPTRQGLVVGVAINIVLCILCGWLGVGSYRAHQAEHRRDVFLAVGREAALDLTAIDWQHVRDDVQRVVDLSTGKFHDDFSSRAQPFIDVVTQAQSKSESSIVEAGVESASDSDAQVLVAVAVRTSTAAAPQGNPRNWRMRISLQSVGNDTRVSDVQFVP